MGGQVCRVEPQRVGGEAWGRVDEQHTPALGREPLVARHALALYPEHGGELFQ